MEDRHETHDSMPKDGNFKIFVSNVPHDLETEGLKQIFGKCGDIKEIKRLPNKNYVFITYKTWRDASKAISSTHLVEPYKFYVKWSREPKPTEDFNKPVEPLLPLNTNPEVESSGLQGSQWKRKIPSFVEGKSASEAATRLVQRQSFERNGMVVKNGSIQPKVMSHTDNSLEDFELSNCAENDPVMNRDSGHCNFCHKLTNLRCKDCFTYYCHNSCIRNDAENHKSFCRKLIDSEGRHVPPSDYGSHYVSLFENSRFDVLRTLEIKSFSRNLFICSLHRKACLVLTTPSNKKIRTGILTNSNIFFNDFNPQLEINFVGSKRCQCDEENGSEYSLKGSTPSQYKPIRMEADNQSPQQSETFDNQKQQSKIDNSGQHLSPTADSKPLLKKTNSPKSFELKSPKKKWNNNNSKDINDSLKNVVSPPPKDDAIASDSDNKSIVKINQPNVVENNVKAMEIEDNPVIEEVRCMYIEPSARGDVWVMLSANCKVFSEVQAKLNNPNLKFLPIDGESLEFGDPYVTKFEDVWYRVTVSSVNPLAVLFIDYGNTEDCKTCDLRILPDEFHTSKIPPLVKLIKFKNNDMSKLNIEEECTVLLIKILNQEGYVSTVDLVTPDGALPDLVDLNISEKLDIPSVISVLSENDVGVWISTSKCSNKNIGFIDCDKFKLGKIVDENIPCTKLAPKEVVLASVGADDSEATWQRAVVIDSKEDAALVALIDGGQITTVSKKKLTGVPSKLKSEPYAAAILCFNEPIPYDLISTCGYVSFRVLEPSSSQGVLCKVNILIENGKNAYSGNAYLREWDFFADASDFMDNEKKPLPSLRSLLSFEVPPPLELQEVEQTMEDPFESIHAQIPLGDNRQVKLASWKSSNEVCLLRDSEKIQSKITEIQNDVEQDCVVGKSLTEVPREGAIVGARYSENKLFYRGCVVKRNSEVDAVIEFIDVGIIQTVNVNDLRILSYQSRKHPCFSSHVQLKDVPKSASESVLKKLNDSLNRIFTVKCYGSPPSSVILVDKSGIELNKVLINLVENEGKVQELSDNIYLSQDMEVLPLKTGSDVPIFVLYAEEKYLNSDGVFHATNFDTDYLTVLNNDFYVKINDYYTKAEPKSYKPKKDEMCCGLFDGFWSRAYVLNEGDCYVPGAMLLFCDYGNVAMVPYVNIRRIHKEFLKEPILANLCTIQNFSKLSAQNKQKVISLIQSKVSCDTPFNVEVCYSDGKGYAVTLPLVEELLANNP